MQQLCDFFSFLWSGKGGKMKRPLKGKIVAKAVDKGERVTQDGIIVLDDDGKEQTRLGVRYNELLAFIIGVIAVIQDHE